MNDKSKSKIYSTNYYLNFIINFIFSKIKKYYILKSINTVILFYLFIE
jgi:hypothetical protein